MGDLVLVGECLEGKRLNVQSRRPHQFLGVNRIESNVKVHEWVVEFDVRAQVSEAADVAEICPSATIATDAEMVCEKAIVRSKKDKVSEKIAPGSGTHNTNSYHFGSPSCISVTKCHEEILNAIAKRTREQESAPALLCPLPRP